MLWLVPEPYHHAHSIAFPDDNRYTYRDALTHAEGSVPGDGIPVAIVMAGGYARRIQDTVDIHL